MRARKGIQREEQYVYEMPWEVQEYFAESRWYRQGDWEAFSTHLDDSFKQLVIDMRRMSHEDRFEQAARDPDLRKACKDVYNDDVVDEMFGYDAILQLFFACLSDERLDEIIATFDETTRRNAGYLH